jgi:hypothetical protein
VRLLVGLAAAVAWPGGGMTRAVPLGGAEPSTASMVRDNRPVELHAVLVAYGFLAGLMADRR